MALRGLKLVPALFFLLLITGTIAPPSAHANLITRCAQRVTEYWRGEVSPRAREQALLHESQRLEGQASTMNGMTGRHLSATQVALRNISQITDHFLLMGDIGPLVNLYDNKVKTAERAYLQREKNLTVLENLRTHRTRLQGRNKLDARDRKTFIDEWETLGLLTPTGRASLNAATLPELLSWLDGQTRQIEKENRAHESLMGRLFEEWKQIRKHLNDIIRGADDFLLDRIGQVDNRSRAVELESVRPTAAAASAQRGAVAPAVANQLETLMKQREAEVKQKRERLAERIGEVEIWLDRARAEGSASLAIAELKTFLTNNRYLNDDLRTIIAREQLSDADRRTLVAELELLRNRLRDARDMIELAFKLDRVLGVQTSDYATLGHLIPPNALRPTIENFSRVVYNSPVAQRARLRRERWRAVWSFIDGNLLYGNVGAVIPTLGRGADTLRMPFLRNFLYLLFKDLYLQHAENQYFPSLTLLRRAHGDAQKLRRLLENLNAGSKDELLVVFARRADLSSLWRLIKAEAEKNKDVDHHKFHERMLAAERKAQELGPISLINSGSYTRYVVAGVLNGTILYFASKWWLAPGVQSVWSSLFGVQIPNEPPGPWYQRLMAWLVPLAHAQTVDAVNTSPLWIELPGFDEESEEKILSDLETVVHGLVGVGNVTPAALESAALSLFSWERRLSGKTPIEMTTERCPRCPF